MSAGSPAAALRHHPAPHRERVATAAAAFGLLAGPLAWFTQICAGYALASWPCFPGDQRREAPLVRFAWTSSALTWVLIITTVVAVAAFLVAWGSFRRTRDEGGGSYRHAMEIGSGRTRFLALWGMALSGGFAIATLMTAAGMVLLPRCAG